MNEHDPTNNGINLQLSIYICNGEKYLYTRPDSSQNSCFCCWWIYTVYIFTLYSSQLQHGCLLLCGRWLIYMKEFRNSDWLRAVWLIPNSAILCYHSANFCYHSANDSTNLYYSRCKFLLWQCIFVLSHFGEKNIFPGKTNMAAKARKNTRNISLKFEVNSTLIIPVKCPLTELEWKNNLSSKVNISWKTNAKISLKYHLLLSVSILTLFLSLILTSSWLELD